jgi:protein phosphatase
VAIVVDPGLDVCIERNRTRPNRNFGPAVPQRMIQEIRRGLGGLQREGFRQVWKLSSVAETDGATIERRPLWTDQRQDHGPFDIIGDVHGCAGELRALLGQLGYIVDGPPDAPNVTAPHGRKLVFAGDLVDRGPDTPGVLRIAMAALRNGIGYAVQGNHDQKLSRWLNGRDVKIAHGLQESIDQLGRETPEFRDAAKRFLDDLRSHYWLDGGALAVAHAGLKEELIGRGSGAVRDFALYGETTGEIDAFGLPVRLNWAAEYRGKTSVVYGHTPVPGAEWVNNTIDIDTGCVFGGKLTALRWPERELVAVPAAHVYSEPVRPLVPSAEQLSGQAEADKLLDYEDVGGRRFVDTELMGRVVVAEENAAAALEVMSRFAIAPQWLVYLPPTMSPVETSTAPGYLERPEEAFDFFRARGQATAVLEEKHMGSRAVIALCRDDDVAHRRFGVDGDESGQIWTRTGRAFFDAPTRDAVLTRLRQAADAAKLWDELGSDWVLLDAEIMPWSFKASGLIADQYEPVATASRDGLTQATAALDAAKSRGVDVGGLDARFAERLDRAARYARAWAPYAWPVSGIDELRVAPFHVLASEGATHFDRDHRWHMAMAKRLVDAAPGIVTRTRTFEVALADESSCAAGAAWWETIVTTGGEGMVVKPLDFIARGSKGLIQPALKVRGPEYLRIIYGPEYDLSENLERLRKRGLGGKRALALKEFALGHEALRRFTSGSPLRQVHECAFALLALESEPVDPRL